jgi:hypothetical protein
VLLLAIFFATGAQFLAASAQFLPITWLWKGIIPHLSPALLALGALLLVLLLLARFVAALRPRSFLLAALGASLLGAGALAAAGLRDNTPLAALEALLGVCAALGLVWRRLAGTSAIAAAQWAWIVPAGLITFVPLWGTLALLQRSPEYFLPGAITVPPGREATRVNGQDPPFCNARGHPRRPTTPVVVVSIDGIDPAIQAATVTAVLSVPQASIGLSSGPDGPVLPRHRSARAITAIRLVMRRNYDGTSFMQVFRLDPLRSTIQQNDGRMDMQPQYVEEAGVSSYLACPYLTPYGVVTFGAGTQPALPVETDESVYPWDRVRFDYVLAVEPLIGDNAPDGAPVACRRSRSLWQSAEVYVTTTLGPQTNNLVQVAPWQRDPCKKRAEPEVVVQIYRDPLSILFVESVAAVPFVLFILVLETLARWSKKSRTADGSHRTETVALIGAAILAILPLRVVIVPSGITGLTRVDFELGLWLAAIIALALVEVAINVQVQQPADSGSAGIDARGAAAPGRTGRPQNEARKLRDHATLRPGRHPVAEQRAFATGARGNQVPPDVTTSASQTAEGGSDPG